MKKRTSFVTVMFVLAVFAGQAVALTQEEVQLEQMKYYMYQAGQNLLDAQKQIENAKKQGADVSYAIQEFTRAKEAYDQAVANAHDAETYYEFGEYETFSSLALNATVQATITIQSAEKISDDVQVQVEQKKAEEGNLTWTEKLNALELEINATQKRYDDLNQSVNKAEGIEYLNQSRYYLSQARVYAEKNDDQNTRKQYLLSVGSLKQAQIILQSLLAEKGETVPVFIVKGAERQIQAEPEILPPAGNQTSGQAPAQDNTLFLLGFGAVLALVLLIIAVGLIISKTRKGKPGKTKTLYEMLLEQEKKKKKR